MRAVPEHPRVRYKVMNQNNEPSKIVFEGEEFRQPAQSFQTPTPKIVGWVMKYSGGSIRDEKQANYVLIGFVVLAIIVFLMVILGGGSEIPPPPPTPFQESNL